MKYHFKIHKEGKGYWAHCIEFNGCFTQGDSHQELLYNMSEALNLYLDEPMDSQVIFPLPDKKLRGRNIVEIKVEVKIAFCMLLRRLRLKHHLTQKEAAKKMGLKNIFSYQRLESSKTANPAITTLAKIKEIFPSFGLDKIFS